MAAKKIIKRQRSIKTKISAYQRPHGGAQNRQRRQWHQWHEKISSSSGSGKTWLWLA